MKRRFPLIAACIAGLLSSAPQMAQAADLPASVRQGDDGSPCADAGVLGRIHAKFRYQVRHVPNLPDVDISEFRGVHQHRYEPRQEDNPIARRYCGATALLSDGRERDVWFLIEEGMGLAGLGDNVEFCVAGFDRWFVYNGRCRVLW